MIVTTKDIAGKNFQEHGFDASFEGDRDFFGDSFEFRREGFAKILTFPNTVKRKKAF